METYQSGAGWYSPSEALEVLEARYGSGTKALIADKLKDGLIRAHAELVWDSREPSLDTAWRKREETLAAGDIANIERDSLIEKEVWRESRHWAFDLENWRWLENRFVVTRRKKPADRTIIEGMKLSQDDINNLAKPPSKRGGRRPNYNGWANLFCALLDLDRSGQLKPEIFKNKASLERHLVERFAQSELSRKDNLDEETIGRCAHAVWDRVIGPG